jgi:hypothetical protein
MQCGEIQWRDVVSPTGTARHARHQSRIQHGACAWRDACDDDVLAQTNFQPALNATVIAVAFDSSALALVGRTRVLIADHVCAIAQALNASSIDVTGSPTLTSSVTRCVW